MNIFKDQKLPRCFSVIKQAVAFTGVDAFVVGGFVRDFLLTGTFTFKDIDIVVLDGRGDDLCKKVAELLSVPYTIVGAYGTSALKTEDGIDIEFVSARKESYSPNSRKPSVTQGTLLDDLYRRDFTINAICADLNQYTWGDIVDPLKGVKDLEVGLLKCPQNPDETFFDDPLRIIRAIRFAANLGLRIDLSVVSGIERNLNRLKGEGRRPVSVERVTQEINKMLQRDNPSRGFRIMKSLGILDIILPELSALSGRESNGGVLHKDNFDHTMKVLDNVCEVSDDLWMRWVALLHDIGKPSCKRKNVKNGWSFHGHAAEGAKMIPAIFDRLKLPKDNKMNFVIKLTELHQRPSDWGRGQVTESSVRRLMSDSGEYFSDLLLFCRCDITTKNEALEEKYKSLLNYIWEVSEKVSEKINLAKWTHPANGHILMKELGLSQGRELGLILNRIKEAVLDGEIPYDQGEAVDYAKRILSKR